MNRLKQWIIKRLFSQEEQYVIRVALVHTEDSLRNDRLEALDDFTLHDVRAAQQLFGVS